MSDTAFVILIAAIYVLSEIVGIVIDYIKA